jgi:hypothetical protein
MNEDYRRRHGDAEWVMNQLELYLARAELAGEGDLPSWISF